MFTNLIFLSFLLFGLPVLLVSSPTLGELIATMAPLYPRNDNQLVEGMGIPFSKVCFPTWDGKVLTGWFFPVEGHDRPAIIYAPATAKDQRSGISLVKPLHQAGYQVLLFSYRGHGHSEGNPFGFTYGAQESQDIDAAADFLSQQLGIGKIGVIGHSAGAVSGLLSAARNQRIKAVVAAAPFPSVEDIWNTNRPTLLPKGLFEWSFRFAEWRKKFSRDEVRPQDVISQIGPRGLLLIHGLEDRRITRQQAMQMFAAATEPKKLWLVEGASHAEVRFPVLDSQIERIVQFFNSALNGLDQQTSEIRRIAL
jgi:dipeptidyl aminopeptidase/acylaminoacyl peptidase